MILLIGPEESAKAMARKFGMAPNDYTVVSRAHRIPPVSKADIIHATHDAWTLPNGEFDRIKISLANMIGNAV